jgi:hypothetical protein
MLTTVQLRIFCPATYQAKYKNTAVTILLEQSAKNIRT